MKRLVAVSVDAALTTALIAALLAAVGGSATAVQGGGNLLRNPGFEQGDNGVWKGNPENTLTTSDPHSGAWIAYMAATGVPNRDTLFQRVTIPAGSAATLTFWLKLTTDEPVGNMDDTFEVKVTNAAGTTRTHRTLTSADATDPGVYVRHRVRLNRYLGRTVTVRFITNEDQGNRTDFQLDDTALRVS